MRKQGWQLVFGRGNGIEVILFLFETLIFFRKNNLINFPSQFFTALASLGYEKSCVLFNCAALASQIAAEQNLDNDEGLKIAAKHYQVCRTVVTT